jgi:hypothetical protein
LHRLEAIFAREGKGGQGRSQKGFYRGCCLAEGARVCAGRGDGRWRSVGLGRGSVPGKKRQLTGGPGLSARRRGWGGTLSERSDTGPGRFWRLGRILSPRPFTPFLISFRFSFLFSDLFCIFCKYASNQLKTTSKFL